MATTAADRQRRAAQDLAKKIRLEGDLSLDMKNIFKKISISAKNLFSASGARLNVFDFKDQIAEILKNHYKKVFKAFQQPMINDIQSQVRAKQNELDDELDKQNLIFFDDQSQIQAQTITNTTQNQLNAAYGAAIIAALMSNQEETQAIDHDEIADEASVEFDEKSNQRVPIIALTETQSAAETSKNNVALVLAATSVIARSTQKEWRTVLDGRQRESHDQADGQRQSVDDPFIVQGQKLMYPGDTSLGATADNIINCRCSTQYVISTEGLV